MAEQSYEWSPYAYGYNNPMKYTDPTGMTASDTTLYELKDIVIDGVAKGAKNAGTNIFILFAGGTGASILSNLASCYIFERLQCIGRFYMGNRSRTQRF